MKPSWSSPRGRLRAVKPSWPSPRGRPRGGPSLAAHVNASATSTRRMFAKIDVDFAELRRPKVSIFLGARQNARACSRCFGDQLTVGGGLQSIWMTKEDVATSSVERGRRRRVLANRLVFGRETRIPPTSRWSPRNAGPHGVERVPALRARSPGHAKLSGRPDGALRAPESRWCDELCTQCPAESPLSGRPTRR